MKKILFIFIIVLMLFSACNKKVEKSDIDWVNEGIANLDDEITLKNQNAVSAIRIIYDSLSETEKNSIVNYEKLVAAEEKIFDLKVENGDISFLNFSSLKVIINFDNELVLENEKASNFLEKLSEVAGEKENKSGGNFENKVEIIIGDEKIIYYEGNSYYSLNDKTYKIVKGDLNFVFELNK